MTVINLRNQFNLNADRIDKCAIGAGIVATLWTAVIFAIYGRTPYALISIAAVGLSAEVARRAHNEHKKQVQAERDSGFDSIIQSVIKDMPSQMANSMIGCPPEWLEIDPVLSKNIMQAELLLIELNRERERYIEMMREYGDGHGID